MKLFVWDDVPQKVFGGASLYVMAEDLAEARRVMQTTTVEWSGDGPNSPAETVLLVITRAPDRVYDAPAAVLCKWED